MQNGTHAEALEAGFTPKQAVLFTRACVDIKNECWDHFEKQLHRKERARIEKYAPIVIAFCIGASISAVIFTQ